MLTELELLVAGLQRAAAIREVPRSHDRERPPGHVQQKRLRQLELVGEPRPKQRADETERNRSDQAALAASGDSLGNGSAHSRDRNQDDQRRS
jgi:hypothetical protein